MIHAVATKLSYRREFLASVVLFFVSLPLCMGIAMACGVPSHKGLLTGIIGGLVVGSLRGCRLQVSGPAAGLTVSVIELVREHGLAILGPAVAVAGVLQFIAARARLGQMFLAVSPSVVRGLLTGIGLIIVASQIHIMLDLEPPGSNVSNIISLPRQLRKVFSDQGYQHQLAAQIGLLTIVTMLLWRIFKLDKRLHVPEALPAIVLATLAACVFGLKVHRINMPDSIGDMLTIATPTQWSQLCSLTLIKLVVTLAVIASAETLLTTASIDRMTPGEHSDLNRELGRHGIGNIICGLLGGLPLTGVIVRSKANHEAGAQTRLSSILQGLWLALSVALLPWLLEHVPTSALAAMLVLIGIKLIDWSAVSQLKEFGWAEVAIFASTGILIATVDLLSGVAIGFLLSLVRVAWLALHLEVRIQHSGKRYDVYLAGVGSFTSKPTLLKKLDSIPRDADIEVQVHDEGLRMFDHACLELISVWVESRRKIGQAIVVDLAALTGKAAGK